MKKIIKAPNCVVALLILCVALGCDKEYSSIESDVLGEGNFNFNAEQVEIPIKSYNRNISAQQINGLTANLLGFFKDPIYGETTASIITQVRPSSFVSIGNDSIFGDNPIIESVTLTIPYFSTQTGINTTNGKPEYRIDSLFVKNNDTANIKPIRLKVYENTYFLRSFNPNAPGSNSQNYFSKADGSINNTDNFALTENRTINFDEYKGELFCDSLYTISPAAQEVKTVVGTDTTTTYLPPAIKLNLATTDESKARWKALILDQAGMSALSNVNEFQNHLRGLYIKAETENNDGSMVLLNLASIETAIIDVNYSSDDGDDEDTDRETGTFKLNFAGNRLNTFINNYNATILPTTPNITDGDEKLFLKGTEGAMAVIELFSGNGDCGDSALECFKKFFRETDDNGNYITINEQFQLKRLINEAHLVIYEDETYIKPTDPKDPKGNDYHEYDRLFVYNLENNSPILDYNSDITAAPRDPLFSRTFSLGKRITDDEGVSSYKLKVTDLLNAILIRDIDVTKLGLVPTNNVNVILNSELLNSTDDVTGVPTTAVITPRGTVLHGSNSDDDNKKMRLDVFFTEIE